MAPGIGFNPNAPPEMTVLADHPSRANNESPDYLGLESRLSAVFDIVRHKQTRCPITVAIYGDWGTGKTSAMRWLETQLRQWNTIPEAKRDGHPRVHPVWFDPWRYQTREEVWRGIIAEVILSLFSVGNLDRENFPTRIREAARMFGSFLGRGFLHALANIEVSVGKKDVVEAKVSGEMFRDVFDEYEKAAQPAKAYLNQFEATLRQWVEKFLPKNKEGVTERLALFIDDLDRCLPAVTLEVLEALKLYLNIEPLVFVVGLDRAVVNAVVAKHYTDAGVDPGKSKKYLDKLFQIEIRIPPSEKQMEGYLNKQLEALDKSTGGYWHKTLANDEYRQALEDGIRRLARHNPREVKRLLSSSLLSGRAAADNPLLPVEADGEKARQLRFAQGVQFFLLQRFIQDRFFDATHVLLEKRSLHWFEELSKFIRKHPDFSLTPEFLSSERAKPEGKPEEADWPKELRDLLDQRPADDSGKPLDLAILVDPKEPFLWPLLRVPFSAEVAQFAPKTEPQPPPVSVPPDTAKRTAEDDVRQRFSSTVLNRAARDLKLPVDQLTSAHLLQLRELNLSDSGAKDSELAGIATLTGLRHLKLRGTKVTDAGLKELAKLTALQHLNLEWTQVTDAGLKELTKLTALQTLDLWGTQVTDAGLKELAKLTALQTLNLMGTQVTKAGVAEVRSKLPKTDIFL
ncbi:MAG: P-loop NTPase fold protein [Verrucomicrobiia bacterium]